MPQQQKTIIFSSPGFGGETWVNFIRFCCGILLARAPIMWSLSLTSDTLCSLHAEYRGVHVMYGLLFINIKLSRTPCFILYWIVNHWERCSLLHCFCIVLFSFKVSVCLSKHMICLCICFDSLRTISSVLNLLSLCLVFYSFITVMSGICFYHLNFKLV